MKSFGTVVRLLMLIPSVLVSQTWQIVWEEEFEGSELDQSTWSYMTGDGTNVGLPSGWGNNELQYYRPENVTVADGKLTITAKKESFSGFGYTSARLRTAGKGDWTYGRFEMSARLPSGKGIWPAFWMLPTDNAYGGWAASGEIDIMEIVGHEPGVLHGTIHYGGSWPSNMQSGNAYTLPGGKSFAEDFHLFAIEWEQGVIRWYVDSVLYSTKTSWYSSNGTFPAPFDKNFHLLLNVAVGGNWPGSPDTSTVFPQTMIVDYVRVYQDSAQVATSVEDVGEAPGTFRLDQNYPNPFNPTTTISYSLPVESAVEVSVMNMLGQRVATLDVGIQEAGAQTTTFNATGLPSGMYVYGLRIGRQMQKRKMMLVK